MILLMKNKLIMPNKTKTARNILSLNADEVLEFFLKSEQFHGFELPEYFDFDNVLDYVRKTIGDKSYEDCLTNVLPDDLDNVNLDMFHEGKDKHGNQRVPDSRNIYGCNRGSYRFTLPYETKNRRLI